MVQVVKLQPNKCKAPSSNPSTTIGRERERETERERERERTEEVPEL
jgi:hypothetical protein